MAEKALGAVNGTVQRAGCVRPEVSAATYVGGGAKPIVALARKEGGIVLDTALDLPVSDSNLEPGG